MLGRLILGLSLVLTPLAARAGADDIVFVAPMSADDQSFATYSDATGRAEVTLERETLKMTWKITYQGLSAPPISVGFYGPENVGGTAGLVVDAGKNGLKSPIQGSAVLTDGQFSYLITSRMYVNIHTAKWKEGEIRGQLRRVRKPTVTQ